MLTQQGSLIVQIPMTIDEGNY